MQTKDNLTFNNICLDFTLFHFKAVARDFEVVFAHKFEDIVAHGAVLNIGLDALEGIKHRRRALIYMAVRLCNIVDVFFGEAGMLAHHNGIDAIVDHRVVGHDSIGGHIGADTRATLDEGILSEPAFLIDDDIRRQDRAFVDENVSGDCHSIAEHAAANDLAVVSDMAVCADEAVRADGCSPLVVDAAVDDDVLTDDGVVAHEAVSVLSFPAEVLGIGAYDGTLVDFYVFSKCCAMDNACVWHDLAAVANDDVAVDKCEGMDCDVLTDLCRWIDVCGRAYHGYSMV